MKRSYENSVQLAPKSQERSEFGHEFLLTKEKAHETDLMSVQQVPKVNINQRDDLLMFLLLKDTNCQQVTAVQWAPEEIGLLASSSDDGTVKIWKLTSQHIHV
ncbi:hypothetical protein POM88_004916 [Heracleum sosnowskyi]|uniref:Uncharacterized protein n=1 Tax=Heracleum sosnowskyi TaxID=360622 RepID=A0AAD8JMJ0_9APIA|nr:hypothetical protein POM88_004916 [Heracleum sosnowskyi]